MIPCSKLTDRWGRKRCFTLGLTLYGIGALISAVSPNLGVLILGNSVLEGVGHCAPDPAGLHPRDAVVHRPHLARLGLRRDQRARRHRRGGRAADRRRDHDRRSAGAPRSSSRRSSSRSIVLLSRRLVDPLAADPTRPFDAVGAILSGVGMFCIVFGILQAGSNNALLAVFLVVGARLPARRSSSSSAPGSARARRRCSRPGCSRTGRATSRSSRRTSSGWCCWGRRSSSPSSCRRFAATARSRPASSSPRRRSASSSRLSPPSDSPSGSRRRR